MNQRTIQTPVTRKGVGLFTGVETECRILPAMPDTGIWFVRSDLPNRPKIRAIVDNTVESPRRTAIGAEGAHIETIEHLMSALSALGIDNAEIEVSAEEVPILDGSAREWVSALQDAGISEQDRPRKPIKVESPISVSKGDSSVVALPNEEGGLMVSYTLNYDAHPFIGSQHFSYSGNDQAFIDDISKARTFCLEEEVEGFNQMNPNHGGSKENTLVVGHEGVIENELRYADEFVRHKVLDLIGDLSLAGRPLNAHIVAVKSGHSLNHDLVRAVLEAAEKWERQAQAETWLDVREIVKILPHRYPFLFIDKVVELDGFRRAVGIKNVTFNEPYFQGHFPDQPIMPGVLQLEAMAQLAGVLLMRKAENQNKLAVLLSLDEVKLRRSVVPGDQLRIEVETLKVKHRTGHVYARATVDSNLVAEAQMKFMLVDPE